MIKLGQFKSAYRLKGFECVQKTSKTRESHNRVGTDCYYLKYKEKGSEKNTIREQGQMEKTRIIGW